MNVRSQNESQSVESTRLHQRPFTLSMISGLTLCAAFPLIGLWPLAFLAPIGWLILIEHRDASKSPRFYRKVWLGSWAHWLGTVYFVIMPHWAGFFGWIAMSLYLSIYYLLFVVGSRVLVHRFRVPLLWAAPIAWVAVDWLRAHVITGFGMAMLPHAMFKQPLLIQTADLGGDYFLSFLMILGTTSVFIAFWKRGKPQFNWRPILVATTVVVFVLSYGAYRLQEQTGKDVALVAGLIQGSIDVTFPDTFEEAQRIQRTQFEQYRTLTIQARELWPDLELVIWPESIFPQNDWLPNEGESELSDLERSNIESFRESNIILWKMCTGALTPRDFPAGLSTFSNAIPMLTGGHVTDPITDEQFNSVLYFADDQIKSRYHKEHRVMFGEYVPFGEYFPFVYDWMPIDGGLTPGDGPVSMKVNGALLAPNICFESTVTHLVRRHILKLRAAGKDPTAVVNVTNDGWFYGTNCLDLHLACNVFRAVENRTPVLVAANTGFSAHIDGNGRLLSVGPRRDTTVLRAELVADPRNSLYQAIGDWPAFICMLVLVAAIIAEIIIRRRERTASSIT